MTETYYTANEGWPRTYSLTTTPSESRWERFVAVGAPFIVHSKCHVFKKPQPFVVRAVSSRDLLVQKIGDFLEPGCHENYAKTHAAGSWHTISFDNTTEGYRFVRTVRKVVEVLAKLGREATKVRKTAEKLKADYDGRGVRCGICPICFGDYVAVPSTKMVHHGYERPGIGYIVGDCYGVDRQPFEVSCKATKEWLVIVKQRLTSLRQSLFDLPKRASVTVERGTLRNPKPVVLKRGEDGFAAAIEHIKYELERDIRYVTKDVAFYSDKIKSWKPVQFPRQ